MATTLWFEIVTTSTTLRRVTIDCKGLVDDVMKTMFSDLIQLVPSNSSDSSALALGRPKNEFIRNVVEELNFSMLLPRHLLFEEEARNHYMKSLFQMVSLMFPRLRRFSFGTLMDAKVLIFEGLQLPNLHTLAMRQVSIIDKGVPESLSSPHIPISVKCPSVSSVTLGKMSLEALELLLKQWWHDSLPSSRRLKLYVESLFSSRSCFSAPEELRAQLNSIRRIYMDQCIIFVVENI